MLPLIWLASVTLLAILASAGGVALAIRYGWPQIIGALERRVDARVRPFQQELRELKSDIDSLPALYEQSENEVKRLHARAYHHVRRARQELEARGLADAELDQIDASLQLVDGERGIKSGVPGVPEAMAQRVPEIPSAAALTWQQRTMRYKHGAG